MAITLNSLITQVRSRSNMEHSEFITDDELTTYINQGYEELYDYLVSSWEDYSLNSVSFTLSGTTDTYPLPDILYKLRGLDRQTSNGKYYSVQRFIFKDRNEYNSSADILFSNRQNPVKYSMEGSNIKLIPQNQVAGTYQLWFVPNLTLLDGYTNVRPDLEKFVDFIVTSASIKALAKEESDVAVFFAQLEMIKQRITKLMTNRDDAIPMHVGSWQDAESRGYGWWNR